MIKKDVRMAHSDFPEEENDDKNQLYLQFVFLSSQKCSISCSKVILKFLLTFIIITFVNSLQKIRKNRLKTRFKKGKSPVDYDKSQKQLFVQTKSKAKSKTN